MAAAFSPGDITQPGAKLGFDSLAGWVMVPQGGTKSVVLKDGAGLALQLAPTGVAELSETSTQNGTGDLTHRETLRHRPPRSPRRIWPEHKLLLKSVSGGEEQYLHSSISGSIRAVVRSA